MFNIITWFKNQKSIRARKALDKKLTAVYHTLKWIEKMFPNRKSRKTFIRDLLKNGFIHSTYIDMFLAGVDKEPKTFIQTVKENLLALVPVKMRKKK